MKKYAEKFYKSKTWQQCRDAYVAKQGGLCEMCLAVGLYKPGTVVHHVQNITPFNIDDPTVTLNFDNLMLLCADHHAHVHKQKKRYIVNAQGNVVAV